MAFVQMKNRNGNEITRKRNIYVYKTISENQRKTNSVAVIVHSTKHRGDVNGGREIALQSKKMHDECKWNSVSLIETRINEKTKRNRTELVGR